MNDTSRRPLAAGLEYAFARRPAVGEAMAVAPGIRWLRVPLPFALDHINLWLLEDGDGWTVVDTGINSVDCRDQWAQVIANHADGRPIHRVIATHFHPDHVGLAGWFVEEFGAELWMTRTEWLTARMYALDDSEAWSENFIEFYRAAGGTDEFLAATRQRRNPYVALVAPIPLRYRRLVDAQQFTIDGRTWEVVIGEGHSPEHACLWCAELDVLIAGDQVLPRISPIVGVHAPEPAASPLDDFLASIKRLRDRLPADALVLPSHNEPFTGLHARLNALAAHHDERLARLAEACAEPQSSVELARVLFDRPLDEHQMAFAIAETLSHLRVLEDRGTIVEHPAVDGVRRYARG